MSEEEKQPEQEEKQAPQEEPQSEGRSKMMNDMLKGLRDFGTAALDKAEEYGKIASDKAEELTKQGKTKLDIHQLNRSRSKQLAELGQLVMDLGDEKNLKKLAEHEIYLTLVKSIKDIEVEIKEKEAHDESAELEADETKQD